MPLTSLRIFVACPADVNPERERLYTTVEDLKELAQHFNVTLELVDWRRVVPDLGRPEEVILDQLKPTSWDLFIGILWHRFGTPPGRGFKSGTQEEFDLAYKLWSKYKRPSVKFYRCTRRYPSNVDPDQLKLVNEFFQAFAPDGPHPGLYAGFNSADEFERLTRRHLMGFLVAYSNMLGTGEAQPADWKQNRGNAFAFRELMGNVESRTTLIYTCRATFTGEHCPLQRPIKKALWTHVPVDEIQTFCLAMCSLGTVGQETQEDDGEQSVICSMKASSLLFGEASLTRLLADRNLVIVGENNFSNLLLDMMAAYLPWRSHSGAISEWSPSSGRPRPHVYIRLKRGFNSPLTSSHKEEVHRGGGMIALFPNPFNIRNKVLVIFGCHREGQLSLENWLRGPQIWSVIDSLNRAKGGFVGSWAAQVIVDGVWDPSSTPESARAAAIPNSADGNRPLWFVGLGRAIDDEALVVNRECLEPHDFYDLSLVVVLSAEDQSELRQAVLSRIDLPQWYWEDQECEIGFHITLFEFCTHHSISQDFLAKAAAIADRIRDGLEKNDRDRPKNIHVRLRGLDLLPSALISYADFLSNGRVSDWLDSVRSWCEDVITKELGQVGRQSTILNAKRVPFPAHVTVCRINHEVPDAIQVKLKRATEELRFAELHRFSVDKITLTAARKTPYRQVAKITEIGLRRDPG
jgi:hypothetical protein